MKMAVEIHAENTREKHCEIGVEKKLSSKIKRWHKFHSIFTLQFYVTFVSTKSNNLFLFHFILIPLSRHGAGAYHHRHLLSRIHIHYP